MSNRDFHLKKKSGFTLIEVIISLGVFGLIIGSLFSLLPWGVEKASALVDRNTALGMVDAVQIELERLGFSVVEHGTTRLDGLYDGVNEPSDKKGKVYGLILVATRNGQRVAFEKVKEVEQGNNPINFGDYADGVEAYPPLEEIETDYLGTIQINRRDKRPISLNGFEFPEDIKFLSRWIEPNERYFVIVCSQYAKFPKGNSNPPSRHMHHPSNGYLALQVEIQWPYKIFDPSGTDDFRVVEPRYRSKISFPMAISR
jgi:prepilin-type N-terminal cleavage/methylation domain-containing protein